MVSHLCAKIAKKKPRESFTQRSKPQKRIMVAMVEKQRAIAMKHTPCKKKQCCSIPGFGETRQFCESYNKAYNKPRTDD